MNSLYPSIAFVIVGLAALYIFNKHLSTKQAFVTNQQEVANLQVLLSSKISEVESTKAEFQELKSRILSLEVKTSIKRN